MLLSLNVSALKKTMLDYFFNNIILKKVVFLIINKK